MLVAQFSPILYDPMDYSPSGSSVHGILQARVLEWGAIAFPQFLPDLPVTPFQTNRFFLFFLYFFNFYFYFILLYNTVLVLPYIDMNPPWVYMCSQA